MKKTKLSARLLACMLAVVFCAWGGVTSCSDGSDKDTTPETKYYTVTFDSANDMAVVSKKVEEGKTVEKPDNPTKEGYVFDAWYVEGGNSFDFTSAITADVKLVAKWKDPNKEYCTVTFKESDGKETTQSVEKGTKATRPTADPTKDGYTFLGWYEGDNEFNFATPITTDTKLTAKWEKVEIPGGEENPIPGTDPSKPSEPLEKPSEPVISGPVAGKPTITKASAGELETAYVEWTSNNDNAKWYNVYVSPNPATADSWVKLDGPLVRQYADYFRADALGLAAGTYDMKVVPVSGEDKEATEYASEATGITVYAHERAGYAFVNGTSSGAYNEDGTLKKDAVVLYVTNDNYDKITLQTGKGLMTGIDNILGEGYQSKKGDTKPLCVRIVGSIGTGSKLGFKAGGDLELKGLDQGVTIEGVGNDATANGWGLHITSSSNVEVRNLAFMEMQGTTKDGVSIESKCHHIWVHNCDFFYGHNWGGDQKKGDGSLDTKGSTNITHSYNHFWDSGKCNLQGMEKAEDTGIYQITYHHNWYDHSDSRHPRIRRATVHIYNNYFDGNAKYGVGVTNGASAFVENNYFRSTAKMKPMLSSMQGTDIAHGKDGQTFSGENGGMIKALGNKFDGTYELLTQNDTDANNLECYMDSGRTEQ
ncbi:MAG: InlB B-repeat-containing protein, partial [Treponemataceae bacterium]|nr:InlB B-repeat-containing protein [Treponemataceae bacterium]